MWMSPLSPSVCVSNVNYMCAHISVCIYMHTCIYLCVCLCSLSLPLFCHDLMLQSTPPPPHTVGFEVELVVFTVARQHLKVPPIWVISFPNAEVCKHIR